MTDIFVTKYEEYPVWALSTAVGRGQHCIPIADKTVISAVKEHLPNPERSFIAATFISYSFNALLWKRIYAIFWYH